MKAVLETVGLEGDHSIRVLHYACDAFQQDHGWHFHPEYELSLIIKGQGKRLLGDSIERFAPGDVVFVGPNVPHCWISDDGETENEMRVLQFDAALVDQTLMRIPEAKSLHTLFDQAPRGLLYKGETAAKLGRAMQDLAELEGLNRLIRLIKLLEQLEQSPVEQLLADASYAADSSQFHGGRLAKIMQFLKTHLAEDIKQSDVAGHVHMSPQSFSRFFKATTGRTFVSFVHTMRVTEACRLLANTDNDISQIAADCGYANLSNFNRHFSALKDCTPTQYRRMHSLTY